MTMRARPSTTRRPAARRRGLPGCGRTAGSGPAVVRAWTTGSSLAAGRGSTAEPGGSVPSSSGRGPVMRCGLAAGSAAAAPVRSPLVPLARELVSGPASLLAAAVDGGTRRGGSAAWSCAACSCSRATASARSAFTAACMHCRNSGDSTGIRQPARAGPSTPRPGCGGAVPRPGLCLPCGQTSVRDMQLGRCAPHGTAEHRIGSYSADARQPAFRPAPQSARMALRLLDR